MTKQIENLEARKTFVNRGGVRRMMYKLFPSDELWFVYQQDKANRFYPVIVRLSSDDDLASEEYEIAKANLIAYNEDMLYVGAE